MGEAALPVRPTAGWACCSPGMARSTGCSSAMGKSVSSRVASWRPPSTLPLTWGPDHQIEYEYEGLGLKAQTQNEWSMTDVEGVGHARLEGHCS